MASSGETGFELFDIIAYRSLGYQSFFLPKKETMN